VGWHDNYMELEGNKQMEETRNGRERTYCAAADEHSGELVHRQAGLLGHERLEPFIRQHRVYTDEPGFALLWRHHQPHQPPDECHTDSPTAAVAEEPCFG
jgi:hypothetical protein